MSDIQYGLVSRVDSDCMEKCFDILFQDFPDEVINYLEVGLYTGRSSSGVKEYFDSKGKAISMTGIDNFKDKEQLVHLPDCVKLIEGSSIEVYNELPDESQHYIQIDANHSLPYVIADFYCYAGKLKRNGIICFHDAAPHAQNKSWQRMGREDDEDMNIAVLKALSKIGLTSSPEICKFLGFKLIFHEWDKNDLGSGVIIFRKL